MGAGEDVKLLSLAKLVEPLLPSTPPPPFPPACQGCRAIIDTQEVHLDRQISCRFMMLHVLSSSEHY